MRDTMRGGILTLACSILVFSSLVQSGAVAGVPHPGRRLLSDGYYSDATYTGQMAKVDTSFQSASYTTEAQRSQVAQYAQAAAVASGGSEPYLNVSPVSYDTTALLASYAAKVAAAKEAASTATSSPTTTASTASISSAQVMTQDDSSKQQQQASSPVLEISSWKSVLDKVKNTVNTATEEVANATSNASDAASNLLRISPATEASSPALQQASAADVHAPHHTGSSASITSTAGPITLYNPYQSSDFDRSNHPASAAIDGDASTSSQTTVDTASCSHLNQEGLYGTCGLMVGCLSAPAYTQAYASTPNYPWWTAEFSADASANYRVTHVVLTNRQECCRCPLAGAQIYVGDPAAVDLAQTSNPDLSQDSNWQLCATVPSFDAEPTPLIFSEAAGYTETFLCSESIIGKAVAIQLPFPTTILTLAEVEVVGVQV